MRSVFRPIAKGLDVPFVDVKRSVGLKLESLRVPSVVFNDHSAFGKCAWLLDHPQCRVFHLIRDPRDVIVSAMHHHRTSNEKWLHKRRRAFAGLTYQEKINSLCDDRERLRFEMQNSAGRTIRDMESWDYSLASAIEFRYEDLIGDVELTRFTQLLMHLGFEDHELDACREAVRMNSLFGAIRPQERVHIRSGQGGQWKNVFDAGLAREFLEQFGDALVNLGYELDNSWADLLPER